MKTILFLLAITSVKSSQDCHGVTCPGHNVVEPCDGSLLLGDVSLTATQEEVTDETYKTKGLQVIGCGSWDVYSRRGHQGTETCLESSDGKKSLTDIGLRRVKSVRKRKSTCPRIASSNVVAIVCVVFVVLAMLTVTIVVVRRYRASQTSRHGECRHKPVKMSDTDAV